MMFSWSVLIVKTFTPPSANLPQPRSCQVGGTWSYADAEEGDLTRVRPRLVTHRCLDIDFGHALETTGEFFHFEHLDVYEQGEEWERQDKSPTLLASAFRIPAQAFHVGESRTNRR